MEYEVTMQLRYCPHPFCKLLLKMSECVGVQALWARNGAVANLRGNRWMHNTKVQKKRRRKNLTTVSFAFTHTYTPLKTNIFPFFPQAYMENFEKCAKRKRKNISLSHVICGSSPSFFVPFPYVILDIPILQTG